MGFNTLPFIFIFLPVFLAVYYLMPERLRNGVLTLGSLVFYLLGTWKRPWCLALLLGLMALTWLSGRKLAGSKPLLVGNLLVLGLCLFGFKYAGLLGSGIALPLGLSFYSFQMAAYVIDVYRGRMEPEECPVSYAAEILMFPKLLSGPLMDPADLKAQMYRRTCTLRELDAGLRDFIIGLSMKVLLANQIGGLWRQVKTIGFESVSTPMAWLGLVAYSLQLYLDFCGYSWMAIGVGEMLGFRLPRNFEHPYAARSMRDFWRRWHISLSSWVRDYLFLPLSSFIRRWGQWGVAASLMVTFIALGVWHGAGWTFAVYGFIQGLVIVWELRTERIRNKVRKHIGGRLFATLSVIRTYLIFAVSLVFFKAQSVSDAFYFLRNISFQTHASWKEINIGMSDHICIVAGAALLLMLLYDYLMSKRNQHRRLERQPILLRWTIYYLIVFALFAYGKFGTENFIYLQF